MRSYSMEPRTREYVKGYGFLSFRQNLSNTYGKQLLDAATKTGVGAVKNSSKKLAYKAAEATGEFIGNKIEIAKLVKAKLVTEPNSRNVEQIFIPL